MTEGIKELVSVTTRLLLDNSDVYLHYLCLQLKKEIWYLRTRMKANAEDIIFRAYNLVITDEMLPQIRARNHGALREATEEELRAKTLEKRITNLIGTRDVKDSFFIYGRGNVRHFFESIVIRVYIDLFCLKRTAPEGPFEHRAIKDVIIKTLFTATRGSACLASTCDGGEDSVFNPVPIPTIALAATSVYFWH